METRETMPLWVVLTLALMAAGTVAYLSGYLMIEGLIDYFK